METMMHVDKLSNGLNFSVLPFTQLQTVGIVVGIRYGSIDEEPALNGSAHFLEHMLFKGTKKRTWKAINDETKEFGIRRNAFTDKETTVYYMQVYKKYAENAFDILSDMIKHSAIPEKEFGLERGPIMNENLIRRDNPQFMFYDYIPMAIYKNHPARMPIGGNNELTIKNIKKKDVLGIYKKYYNPGNMFLAVHGGINKSDAIKFAKKYFGDFNSPKVIPSRHPSREKPSKNSIVISKEGIKQTRIGIGFACREFNSKDVYEYVTLNVIAQYLRSKLFDEIREKRGFSYDPMAYYSAYGNFGFIAAGAGTMPRNMSAVESIILKEFENVANGEISKNDLEITKKGLSINIETQKENTLQMPASIVNSALLYGDPELQLNLSSMIKRVSLDDIANYGTRYININKYAKVVLKPR